MENWIIFAVAAMLLFSVSNSLLKLATDKFELNKAISGFLPAIAAGVIAFALVALYLVNSRTVQISPELAWLLVGVIIVALLGLTAFLTSLQQGKVAAVTAVLSLSTIAVALISSKFFAVEFTLKEAGAMILAVISLLLFVL